jgi:hypothetical protein
MSVVLAPRIKLRRVLASRLSKFDEHAAQAEWIEVGQAGGVEGIAEDAADGSGAAPVLKLNSAGLEPMNGTDDNLRRRKQGLVVDPSLVDALVVHPIDHAATHLVANREEERSERLAELGIHS